MSKNSHRDFEISFDKVPNVLRAYANGLLEHLSEDIDPACFNTLVNHDLTSLNASFCVMIHISLNEKFLILEVNSLGVSMADINHYRAAAQASELGEPLPDYPRLFDYADPNFLNNVLFAVKQQCPDLH